LILASMMADNNWTGSDTLLTAQMNMINSHIQTVTFKRIKNTDRTDVLVLADDDLTYSTYKFDKNGRWLGIDIDSDIKLVRTSADKIAHIYRLQSADALRYFMQMEKSLSNEE